MKHTHTSYIYTLAEKLFQHFFFIFYAAFSLCWWKWNFHINCGCLLFVSIVHSFRLGYESIPHAQLVGKGQIRFFLVSREVFLDGPAPSYCVEQRYRTPWQNDENNKHLTFSKICASSKYMCRFTLIYIPFDNDTPKNCLTIKKMRKKCEPNQCANGKNWCDNGLMLKRELYRKNLLFITKQTKLIKCCWKSTSTSNCQWTLGQPYNIMTNVVVYQEVTDIVHFDAFISFYCAALF